MCNIIKYLFSIKQVDFYAFFGLFFALVRDYPPSSRQERDYGGQVIQIKDNCYAKIFF